jgi:D-beta-D-heptose 7-phosphate kinase/D-beta-D-heptose 1-phosphate adenosyltransferase
MFFSVACSNTNIPAAKVPGGAANVCTQMSKFNVDCYLISFKEDENFADQKFNSEYGCKIPGKIPLKRRFYDGDYPLPRWDIEQENYGLSSEELEYYQSRLFIQFEKFIKDKNPDIIVLSDYGKGLFTNYFAKRIIVLCNNHNIPTVVDPKNPPYDQWSGCTYFKPNAFEACKMAEIKHPMDYNWLNHAMTFKNVGIKNTIITDGPNPPFVYDGNVFYYDEIKLAKKPEKNSVIGAGDCFCAFLTMCLAHEMSLKDSVEVAWNSSSLYIESKHNKPIMPYEFARWSDPIHSKIINVDEMERIMNYDKATWAWTNGCFDVMHIGHLKTLEAASKFGNRVIVGLNTDESIKRLKGASRPILPYNIRAEYLAHLQYVDFIVPIDEDTPLSIIERLKPNKIIKGGDYCVKDIAGADVVGHDNVHIIPLIEGLSTSKIIERIKA